MGNRDSRVDAYIARSAEFARPILTHLRETVHAACPEVEETIKWGMPHFVYRGNLCNMAAFKQHCAFGFWKGAVIGIGNDAADEAMGHFGRITRLSDLPAKKTLIGYLKQAMALNEQGVRVPRTKRSKPKPPVVVPDDFTAALRKNSKARATFDRFPTSQRRDYVEWIAEARREDTRQRRLAQAVEWLAAGKPRNWKYMKR